MTSNKNGCVYLRIFLVASSCIRANIHSRQRLPLLCSTSRGCSYCTWCSLPTIQTQLQITVGNNYIIHARQSKHKAVINTMQITLLTAGRQKGNDYSGVLKLMTSYRGDWALASARRKCRQITFACQENLGRAGCDTHGKKHDGLVSI